MKIKETKSFPALITAVDNDKGIVEAIVAVIGNIDKGKDRIWKGSFTKTLTENFKNIRVLDNHNATSVLDIVGKPLEIRELSKTELPEKLLLENPTATGGLYTKTQYAMTTAKGFDTFNLLKEGFITEYSIGFVVPRGKSDVTQEDVEGKRTPVRNIREVILYEYSPVIWAMGIGTQTMNVMGEKFNNETKESINNTLYRLRKTFEDKYLLTEVQGDYTYTYPQYYVNDIFSDYIIVCPCYGSEMEYPCYKVGYTYDQINDEFRFDDITSWIGGSYQFQIGTKEFDVDLEIKAGKVLSSANQELVEAAILALTALKEAAKRYESEDEKELDSVSDNNSDVPEEKTNDDLAEANTDSLTSPLDLEVQKQLILTNLNIKRMKNA